MFRLDHIALRTADRHKTAKFFIDCLGYQIENEFQPKFSDGTNQGVNCLVLSKNYPDQSRIREGTTGPPDYFGCEFHAPPEIFISDGPPDSIVGKWVAERGGVGGIHHLAYEIENVEKVMDEWKQKGYNEFLTDKPITCPGLEQVFTKPSNALGVIIELIHRGKDGFYKRWQYIIDNHYEKW